MASATGASSVSIEPASTTKISKNNKIYSGRGILEELIAYIGLIKARYFCANTENKFQTIISTKIFLNGRLTQIQEVLYDIIKSIITSKKNIQKYEQSRFQDEEKIKELDQEIEIMSIDLDKVKHINFIPGSSELESEIFIARSITRKAERQLSYKNKEFVIDELALKYLDKLSDYFLCLAIHVLYIQAKNPMQVISKKT